MNSVQAFIAFLRCEASLAEERANRLRLTASLIHANLQNDAGESGRSDEWAEISLQCMNCLCIAILEFPKD